MREVLQASPIAGPFFLVARLLVQSPSPVDQKRGLAGANRRACNATQPEANLTQRGEQDVHAALCALSNKGALRRVCYKFPLLWRVESDMANRAEEARARLEERFRKQYEADRTAEKDTAERDTQVGRERSKPTTRDSSADPKGGRQGGWD